MTPGGVCLLSGKVRNRNWGVREAEDVGGKEVPDLQVLPVPAEQSEVAGRGREGRLPLIARCHRGQRDKDHGCCDLAGILAQEGNMPCTQEPRKTCLPDDTSFMQLERKRSVRQARPAGRRTSEWQATILRDGAKDVVALKRSNPESFDERLKGHRGGCGDA